MRDYNVVYRHLAGPQKGLAFWSTYPDQAAFEKDRAAGDPSRLEVVVAGVSRQDAIGICDRIYKGALPDDLVAGARVESTDPTTGKLIPRIFAMKLITIGMARNSM